MVSAAVAAFQPLHVQLLGFHVHVREPSERTVPTREGRDET
jgi:hypothetical protein